MEDENDTIVSGLSETMKIQRVDCSGGNNRWVICDTMINRQIPIDPDEVPELIAMLDAFRSHCIENEDVPLTPESEIDSPSAVSVGVEQSTD